MWSNGCLAGMEYFQDLSILHYEYSLTLSFRMDKTVTLTHLNSLVLFYYSATIAFGLLTFATNKFELNCVCVAWGEPLTSDMRYR